MTHAAGFLSGLVSWGVERRLRRPRTGAPMRLLIIALLLASISGLGCGEDPIDPGPSDVFMTPVPDTEAAARAPRIGAIASWSGCGCAVPPL